MLNQLSAQMIASVSSILLQMRSSLQSSLSASAVENEPVQAATEEGESDEAMLTRLQRERQVISLPLVCSRLNLVLATDVARSAGRTAAKRSRWHVY